MDDIEIVELFWNRSEIAVTYTSEKYQCYCYRISMNILNNHEDANECVNDTYMNVWNSIPPNRPANFRTWLGKITRNLSLDRYRRLRAQKRGGDTLEVLFSELEDCIPDKVNTENFMEDIEIVRLIEKFLRTSREDNRIIFLRRYFYGDSIEKISKQLCISKSKAKSSLFRTRRSLRDFLQREGVSI